MLRAVQGGEHGASAAVGTVGHRTCDVDSYEYSTEISLQVRLELQSPAPRAPQADRAKGPDAGAGGESVSLSSDTAK
jgi:hypothetical protein